LRWPWPLGCIRSPVRKQARYTVMYNSQAQFQQRGRPTNPAILPFRRQRRAE
jgi:hypothetical protein